MTRASTAGSTGASTRQAATIWDARLGRKSRKLSCARYTRRWPAIRCMRAVASRMNRGQMPSRTREVPTRPFGRTGIPVSILALGGWHIGLPKTEREATRLVHAAIDGGITFMDNAWDYNEGVSETRMGKALVGRRDSVFLMAGASTHGRDARAAVRQLEDSLRRMKIDYL